MAHEKGPLSGNTTMLVLRLLDGRDMYGYQIIEELARQSDNTFTLKTGTLYPLLHGLEQEGMVSSYEDKADSARVRRYYHLTKAGKKLLAEKQAEWTAYSRAVGRILEGGLSHGTA